MQVTVSGVAINDVDVLPCNSFDIDLDGDVDLIDFAEFADQYLTANSESDFDFNGTVELPDFSMFAAHYVHGSSPTTQGETVELLVARLFKFGPMYPNPFSDRATISYAIPTARPVRLTVHDVRGRLVRTVVDRAQTAGSHDAHWDGRDDRGASVASGFYYVRFESNGDVRTSPIVLLR